LGHSVSALVRNPATYVDASRVRVVRGDAFTPSAIAETLEGADAVMSALGARSLGKEDVLERAVPLIVQAMDAAGPKRIIVLGSAGALDTAMNKQPWPAKWFVENVVYNTMLKWPVASQRAQIAALQASDLDWTMAMPPMLANLPPWGRYRVDPDALPFGSALISRADVADFMIEQLSTDKWSRRAVYLSW
jgi:putative NADH-flavin reductase